MVQNKSPKQQGGPRGNGKPKIGAVPAPGTFFFEQQPGEPNKCYAAFRAYLDLGPGRTIKATATRLGKRPPGIRYLSRRFAWRARVQAYAAHLAAAERQATEVMVRDKAGQWLRRQEEVREREWAMHEKCLAAAERALDAFLEREKIKVSFTDIARIVEVASKMGRLASGLATEKAEITGEDGGPIRLQLEAALDKIYGKPIPGEVVEVEEVQRSEAGDQKSATAVREAQNEEQPLLTSAATGGNE